MRIPAVFAMIVLGAATTATAEPKQEETSGRVSLNEDEAGARDKDRNTPRSPSDWVELADPSPAKYGTVFVVVGRDAGSFGKLRITPSKGTVVVKSVKVFFDDGKSKVYKVNQAINAKTKRAATVDLGDPRTIDRVSITTDRKGGEYAVHGSISGGVVAGR